jgi:hypothetical protein
MDCETRMYRIHYRARYRRTRADERSYQGEHSGYWPTEGNGV